MTNHKKLEDILREKPSKVKNGYCEIRFQRVSKTRIDLQGNQMKRADSSIDQGGIVRIFRKGVFGISVFSSISEIGKAIKDAEAFCSIIPKSKFGLKECPTVVDRINSAEGMEFLTVPLDEKVNLIKGYNDILLSSDKIASTRAYYSDSMVENYFSSSDGSFIYESFPDIQVSFSSIARQGNLIQSAHDGVAGSKDYDIAKGLEEKAEKVKERAIDLLSASVPKGGTYDVILDPTLAGTFAHEAFGHLSESDHICENEKLKEVMVLGKEFGSKILNIIDDGSIEGLRGTHKYDDEGVKTRKNYLIKDGYLVGRLHSRTTAKLMNENLTGNARSIGYKYEPIVRMTNTYIDSGKDKLDDMISSIKNGIIAYDFFGGNTALEMFTFSSAYAYSIKDGKVAGLLRDVVLSGNLFETLKNITGISEKVLWTETGGCGKGGQSGLPTPTGSPYIMIKNVVVGGE
jgi:TldD protein